MAEIAILDFDGTLTDVHEEAEDYITVYIEDLARAISVRKQTVEKIWDRAERAIIQSHESYGWKVNGKIVAPAAADPYVMCRVIGDIVLNTINRMQDEDERNAFLQELFQKNYKKAKTSFVSHAKEFLYELSGIMPVYIVTNSKTDTVEDKLRALDSTLSERISILGNAEKYIVEDEWVNVPESILIPGLGRPVYLRRQHYYNVLRDIAQENSTDFREMFVIGDIYELDLALPQHLGSHVCLVGDSLKYEKDFILSSEKGHVAEKLMDILEIVG